MRFGGPSRVNSCVEPDQTYHIANFVFGIGVEISIFECRFGGVVLSAKLLTYQKVIYYY